MRAEPEPREIAQTARRAAAPGSPAAAGARRVLVAEDDDALRRVIAITLAAPGIEVLEARDGEQALRLACSMRPALVLLDWMMPRISGVDVLERLRADERTRSLPVVMVTARDGAADLARAELAGVDAYIVKPFSPLGLCELVERLLR